MGNRHDVFVPTFWFALALMESPGLPGRTIHASSKIYDHEVDGCWLFDPWAKWFALGIMEISSQV